MYHSGQTLDLFRIFETFQGEQKLVSTGYWCPLNRSFPVLQNKKVR